MHIADYDRLSRFQDGAAQSLRRRKTGIRRWLVSGAGENHKFVLHNFVNRDESIIARCPNHLRHLLHGLLRATARQNEGPNILEFLERLVMHRRNSWSGKIASPRPRATFR